MRKLLATECQECGGTGLYRGMLEPKGTAVVCVRCIGTGCQYISYRPFTKRKTLKGVKKVYRVGGFFTPEKERDKMTIAEFYKFYPELGGGLE
jgi:hypothetical protein